MRISFDPALPIAARADEIAALISDHQVVIVAGETGSGKTTQLPKICLQLGRERVAHTQPRRIAARSVATRLASELDVELGDIVGYQVRFTRQTSHQTRVKVMTDGVLLAELQRDRDLRRYDTIIIDEAHERSLNIDFLLGYLKQLLPRRRDLKVIVTSATIDTARFSAHFDDAPVIEVSGRAWPVEVRYRPFDQTTTDQTEAIAEAMLEIATESGTGDALCFLSGEREIRDAADAIDSLDLPGWQTLPLYARLSAAEQQRVFAPHAGRRVVLATNVAETSITVPGIRYVIDAGTARISRYSARTKVQRLPIEPVSQASANQRSGRCGRLGPGIAIRLYSEEDFAARPEFTEPEILRTNLAMVILQMAQAGLGDIVGFPFVEAPPSAQVTDGLRLLSELGALSGQRRHDNVRLTKVGHMLARLPVDPRLGRMLIEGGRRDCLREVLVIVSALAIQDVRERPTEHREKADAFHRRFFTEGGTEAAPATDDAGRPLRHTVHTGTRPDDQVRPDGGGDIIAILRLWRYLRRQRKALSGNAFRRMCRDEYLHFLRIREWEDLHTQLREVVKDLELPVNRSAAPDAAVLTAVLSGLLSHVGLLDVRETTPTKGRRKGPREYLGARGSRFAINPGSALARANPPLVVAVELVETTRLWARTVAEISADQVEQVGAHLLTHTLSEPFWSSRSSSVMAHERVSLLGVPIIAERRVDFGRRDPAQAREIFIRSALVEGDWRTRHAFFARNQKLRAEVEELEDRARRRDIAVDDEQLFEFYSARIPAEVVSGATFDRWWRHHDDKGVLTLTMDDLVRSDRHLDRGAFPDRVSVAGQELAVRYVFEPGAGHDGVHLVLPVALLNQLSASDLSWPVPGLMVETATELIRGLPKQVRTRFVPAPNHAADAVAWLDEHPEPGESFPEALGRALTALTGERVGPHDWRPDALPPHLRPTLVVTESGRELASGKDFDALRTQLADRLSKVLTKASAKRAITGATSWVFGRIEPQITLRRGQTEAIGYPCLVDEGAAVGLVVADTPEKQARQHAQGIRRLLTLVNPDPTRWVVSHLTNTEKVSLADSAYPSVPDLLNDAFLKACDQLAHRFGPPERVRDERTWDALALAVRQEAPDQMRQVTSTIARTLAAASEARRTLTQFAADAPVRRDVTAQLDNLLFNRFASATPDPWFEHLPRYAQACVVRLQAAALHPDRDARLLSDLEEVEHAYAELVEAQPPGPLAPQVEQITFLIEELRVSLFAQQLRTSVPVSLKRVRAAIASARD